MSHKQPLPNRGTKRWSTRWHGAKRKLRRATGILWDYNYDGACSHERIPADERRRWRKWLARQTLAHELQAADDEMDSLFYGSHGDYSYVCNGYCLDCTCDEVLGIEKPKLPPQPSLSVPLAELL
jgi:hypothetical protein